MLRTASRPTTSEIKIEASDIVILPKDEKGRFVGGVGGPGRKKGEPNKINKLVKDYFHEAFIAIQEHPKANLVNWAEENPDKFYLLASKLIPVQVQQEGTVNHAHVSLEGMTVDDLLKLKYGPDYMNRSTLATAQQPAQQEEPNGEEHT